jgi:TetR/AcrR family transcriptional repressor of nem operon
MTNRQKQQYKEGQICGCYFGNFTLELSTASTTIRDKVKSIFQQYIGLVESLLIKAKATGEIPMHIDPATLSRVIISLIEGSILLDKADQSPQHMDNSIRFIKQVLSP